MWKGVHSPSFLAGIQLPGARLGIGWKGDPGRGLTPVGIIENWGTAGAPRAVNAQARKER